MQVFERVTHVPRQHSSPLLGEDGTTTDENDTHDEETESVFPPSTDLYSLQHLQHAYHHEAMLGAALDDTLYPTYMHDLLSDGNERATPRGYLTSPRPADGGVAATGVSFMAAVCGGPHDDLHGARSPSLGSCTSCGTTV